MTPRGLRRVGLYLKGRKGTVFPRHEVVLYGVSVPFLCLTWLMKLYSNINDPGKREFNCKLSSYRKVMEWVFGWLKAHWWCLCTHLDASVAKAVHIIVVCCSLHNIREYFLTEVHRTGLVCKAFTDSWIPYTCTVVLVPGGQGKSGMLYMCTSWNSKEAESDFC